MIYATLPTTISLADAHALIDTMVRQPNGELDIADICKSFLFKQPEQRAWQHHGGETKDGFIDLPVSGRRVCVVAWKLHPTTKDQWGALLQKLGGAPFADALASLGAFTRGGALDLLSTRFKSPAKEWAEAVKRDVEKKRNRPVYSPNENNTNLAVIEGEDQADRDGRWLLAFMWFVLAAAYGGGVMIQLYIPGYGLSGMQLAEKRIAVAFGLPVERLTLDAAEAAKYGLTIEDKSLHEEGGGARAKLGKVIARLERGN